MTTMVERMARAIAGALVEIDARGGALGWVDALEGTKFYYIDIGKLDMKVIAIAALRAMREPSLSMDAAGEDFCGVQGSATDPTHVWQAMIDQAIKDAEQ